MALEECKKGRERQSVLKRRTKQKKQRWTHRTRFFRVLNTSPRKRSPTTKTWTQKTTSMADLIQLLPTRSITQPGFILSTRSIGPSVGALRTLRPRRSASTSWKSSSELDPSDEWPAAEADISRRSRASSRRVGGRRFSSVQGSSPASTANRMRASRKCSRAMAVCSS